MKRTYDLPEWRFYDLLMMLGSAAEISRMLEDRGYPPPPRTTIQGWRNRNLMPARWVPVFLQIALEGQFIPNIEWLKKINDKQKPKKRRGKAGGDRPGSNVWSPGDILS